MTANPLRRTGATSAVLAVLLSLGACGSGTSGRGDESAASAPSGGVSVGDPGAAGPQGSASSAGPSATAGPENSGAGAGRGAGPEYAVASVVDGDTLKVRMDGRKVTVRLIGVDTPETKKPHVAVQCFGEQASRHMQSLVQGRRVQLVADPSQGDEDKYGRLLRYVFVGGTTNVALSQIAGGYGREYTYDTAYAYQGAFRSAQASAQSAHRGTWGGQCHGFHRHDGGASASAAPAGSPASGREGSDTTEQVPSTKPSGHCTIKGNINAHGRKIAHAPGSATYEKTKIDRPGERMFCSAQDAVAAGWRMADD